MTFLRFSAALVFGGVPLAARIDELQPIGPVALTRVSTAFVIGIHVLSRSLLANAVRESARDCFILLLVRAWIV